MRGDLANRTEQWLNRVWYQGEAAPWWLRSLSPLYRGGFLLHRALARPREEKVGGRTVVVIGNLTAGGSGKTPLVLRLCRLLSTAGLRVGVASRGYGRSSKGLQQVTATASPQQVGDEPLLIAQRTGLPVVVAEDRCAAVDRLFLQGVDVVLTDDGLQHHRLPRKLELCVVEVERGFGNGRLLPAGPLREPLARLHEVDWVICNGASTGSGSEAVPGITVDEWTRLHPVSMQLVAGAVRSLDERQSWRLSQFRGCRAHAVAGISNPERFFATLRQAGLNIETHTWPDHHAYRHQDFARLEDELPIIMTEKDAVKCRELGAEGALSRAWYLSVEAQLDGEFERDFVQRVLAAVQAAEDSA